MTYDKFFLSNCASLFFFFCITHICHIRSVLTRYFLVFFFFSSPLCQQFSYSNDVVITRREKEKNECNKMKADNSSSYSSPSLLNIMIPQFQQLLPLEAPLSGTISLEKKNNNNQLYFLSIYFFSVTIFFLFFTCSICLCRKLVKY